jgi:LytR cell envelope-related transcriptional attenuator
MHVIQEIGAYAGLAAMVGLAVLSALYFSQARDVRRLREWAGRAPERAARAVAPSRPVPPPQRGPGPTAQTAPAPGQPPPPGGPAAGTPAGRSAASGGGGAGGPAAPAPAAATGAAPAAATAAAQQDRGAATAPGEGAVAAPGTNDSKGGGDTGQKVPPAVSPAVAIPAVQQAPPGSNARPSAVPGRPPAAGGAAPPRAPGRPAGSRATTSPPFSRSAAEPWYRRLLRGRPEYLVLAVTGVLIIGGALAFAVSQVGGADSSSTRSKAAQSARAAHQPALSPHDVTVSVLNGTTVPGLAAQVGDRVQSEGFRLGNITNGSNQQRARSVVLYSPGASRQAVLVSRRLGIAGRQPMDAESQALGGSAKVVVVVGRDQTP